MKIGIDARFLGNRSKGLGRYTDQLVRNLEALHSPHEFVIFLRNENWDEWSPVNPNFSKVLADFQWYSLDEQRAFPRVLKEARCDVYHFPHFNVPLLAPKPFVVTIHDLILSHFPTVKATTLGPLAYWFKHQMYHLVIRRALFASRHIIAVSEFTKNDVAETYGITKEKISVTLEGIHLPTLIPQEKKGGDVLPLYGIRKPFVLYVGNAYPHKNLEFLLDGFQKLKAKHPNLSLVCVGKHDYFYKRVIDYAQSKQIPGVVFPGYVPDEDLQVLYAEASCYAFPSKYEGFGLPPLEAMSQGTPVASSNSSCLPEVLGDAALYFSPTDSHDMIEVIDRILSDSALASSLVEKGLHHIQKYSWKKMTQKTLHIYEQFA